MTPDFKPLFRKGVLPISMLVQEQMLAYSRRDGCGEFRASSAHGVYRVQYTEGREIVHEMRELSREAEFVSGSTPITLYFYGQATLVIGSDATNTREIALREMIEIPAETPYTITPKNPEAPLWVQTWSPVSERTTTIPAPYASAASRD